jgi:hypothetical protein
VKIRFPQRKMRAGLALVTVALALLVAPQTPARAAGSAQTWSWSDGFEVNPASVWIFAGNPACNGCGSVSTDPIQAHSGHNSAFLETFAPHSFYSALTFLHLGPALNRIVWCSATVYIAPPAGQVNFEIINPADWTYISRKTNDDRPDTSYHAVTVPLWHPTTADVVVRISVVLNGIQSIAIAMVDDVSVRCLFG